MLNRSQLESYLHIEVSEETLDQIEDIWLKAKDARQKEFSVRVIRKIAGIDDLSSIDGFDITIDVPVDQCVIDGPGPKTQKFLVSKAAADKLQIYFCGGVPVRPANMLSIDTTVAALQKEGFIYKALGLDKPAETPEDMKRVHNLMQKYFYGLFVDYRAVMKKAASAGVQPPEYFESSQQIFRTSDVGFYFYPAKERHISGCCMDARYIEKFKAHQNRYVTREEAHKWATVRSTEARDEMNFMFILNVSFEVATNLHASFEDAYRLHRIEVERCKDKNLPAPTEFTAHTIFGDITINSSEARYVNSYKTSYFVMSPEVLKEIGRTHIPVGQCRAWNAKMEQPIIVKDKDMVSERIKEPIAQKDLISFFSFFNKHVSSMADALFSHKLARDDKALPVHISANSTFVKEASVPLTEIGFTRKGQIKDASFFISQKMLDGLVDDFKHLNDQQKDFFKRARYKYQAGLSV